MRELDWIALGLVVMLMPGLAWAEDEVKRYAEDFESAEIGSEPANVMVLEGDFAVQAVEGKKVLVLPGEPVGDFGFLFGPRLQPPVVINATITAVKKGRRSPRFGIGWGGQNGLKLFANPATKKLEIFDNQTKLGDLSFQWESGVPIQLNLSIQEKKGNWQATGYATSTTEAKVGSNSLTVDLREAPRAGRASAWGQPFSGRPIQFNELMVESR